MMRLFSRTMSAVVAAKAGTHTPQHLDSAAEYGARVSRHLASKTRISAFMALARDDSA